MKSMFIIGWKSKDFLLFVLFMQVVLDIAVLFDILVLRQVIGFLCMTFVPGLIIFKLLRMDESDIFELILFSVGFSIAFLILGGLLTNEIGLLLGLTRPLSLLPLMVILNSLNLIGGVLVYLRSGDVKIAKSKSLTISPFVIFFLCLTILSVAGAIFETSFGNNLVLLFTILSMAILFIIGSFSEKLLPSSLYPFAVLIFAITILFHSALISQYIVPYGSDIPGEYVIFKTVESNAQWSSTIPWGTWYGRMNSMLSITILPTCYANILKLDPEWVFKALYPLIFAFVPLGLYQIWQTYVSKKYAFISAFLFIAFETFYTEMLGLGRQMIAELFFVLLFLVITKKKMKPLNKTLAFMIFGFALITSHYALAAIFLFFISFLLATMIAFKHLNKKITIPLIAFFLVLMFAWYIYTSNSATFDSILGFGKSVVQQVGDFLNPQSRGETVLQGLGMAGSPSIWNTISRIFAYLTQGLIVLGFIGLITKRVSARMGKEQFLLSFTAMAFLGMLIVVPGLANTLNMTRFYHILLFFLAPLCILGAEFFVELFSNKRKILVTVLLVFVLAPYFLFQTEFVFEVTGSDSYSVALSGYRMNPLQLINHFGYADSCSVDGAKWLGKNVDQENSIIYASESALSNILRIHGMIYGGNLISNSTIVREGGVLYLSKLNVVYGVITYEGFLWKTSELSFISYDSDIIYTNIVNGVISFEVGLLHANRISFTSSDLDVVYSNGGSEIYKYFP
jgi:uncharacterized membrane protein